MDAEFWHDRWENNLIGFHLDEVNPYLKQYWSQLALPEGARVFVPLCGKSKDMLWLVEQGYHVVGIELSPLAVRAFFAENNLQATVSQQNGMDVWQTENITIFCGDFFQLDADMPGKVDAVYDRASLVALPVNMRAAYAEKFRTLFASASALLVCMEYDQSKMDGPPFSVTQAEVRQWYEDAYQLSLLAEHDILDGNAKFRERGLTSLTESVYLLRPKG